MHYDKDNPADVHDFEYIPWTEQNFSYSQIKDGDYPTFEEWLEMKEEEKAEQYA